MSNFQNSWRPAWLWAAAGAHLGSAVCKEACWGLTEHSDEGLGGSHRHSEDGTGVLALICQGHIADADAELVGCRANQLNPIISKGWKDGENWKPVLYWHLSCYLSCNSRSAIFGVGRYGRQKSAPEFELSLAHSVTFFGPLDPVA